MAAYYLNSKNQIPRSKKEIPSSKLQKNKKPNTKFQDPITPNNKFQRF
jgi:hypothetical protein